jgi:hypothetical protein
MQPINLPRIIASHVPTQCIELAELTEREIAEFSGVLIFQKNCRNEMLSLT